MLLRKKAQSTAEYAITIGIVIAVVAGVMQVALKGGMRKKSAEASNFLTRAGSSSTSTMDSATFGMSGAVLDSAAADFNTYEAESRNTIVSSDGYVDRKIQEKGGAVRAAQQQTTTSTSMTVETYDRTHAAE